MLKKSLVGAPVVVEYRKCAKVYRVIVGNAASQGLCLLFAINGVPG